MLVPSVPLFLAAKRAGEPRSAACQEVEDPFSSIGHAINDIRRQPGPPIRCWPSWSSGTGVLGRAGRKRTASTYPARGHRQ
jgi:hypothetical protein